ncbi:MAG: hypothetical protein AB9834_15795 [Lentimicrobium sp.]
MIEHKHETSLTARIAGFCIQQAGRKQIFFWTILKKGTGIIIQCRLVKGMNKKLTAENRKVYRREPQRNANANCFAALCVSSAHFAFGSFCIQIP